MKGCVSYTYLVMFIPFIIIIISIEKKKKVYKQDTKPHQIHCCGFSVLEGSWVVGVSVGVSVRGHHRHQQRYDDGHQQGHHEFKFMTGEK